MTYDEELLALVETRSNLIVLIGSLTVNPKPNYDIDGQKISWGDYLKQLRDALKGVDEQILQLDSAEEESQGYC